MLLLKKHSLARKKCAKRIIARIRGDGRAEGKVLVRDFKKSKKSGVNGQ